jgi:hypothetical protein
LAIIGELAGRQCPISSRLRAVIYFSVNNLVQKRLLKNGGATTGINCIYLDAAPVRFQNRIQFPNKFHNLQICMAAWS